METGAIATPSIYCRIPSSTPGLQLRHYLHLTNIPGSGCDYK